MSIGSTSRWNSFIRPMARLTVHLSLGLGVVVALSAGGLAAAQGVKTAPVAAEAAQEKGVAVVLKQSKVIKNAQGKEQLVEAHRSSRATSWNTRRPTPITRAAPSTAWRPIFRFPRAWNTCPGVPSPARRWSRRRPRRASRGRAAGAPKSMASRSRCPGQRVPHAALGAGPVARQGRDRGHRARQGRGSGAACRTGCIRCARSGRPSRPRLTPRALSRRH